MTGTEWHASDTLLERFAVDPAVVDDARAASLEAHLIDCATCRISLGRLVEPTVVDDSWAQVRDQIDEPRLTVVERGMVALGVPQDWARILAATPGFRLAGIAAVVAALVGVVVSSRSTDTTGLFLVVAPLFPLAVATAAFLPMADPGGEAGVATPMHGAGLALRRGAALSATMFVLLGLTDLSIGGAGAPLAAWVLPSLALAAGATALGTWYSAPVVLASMGSIWIVVVTSVRWIDGRGTAFADSTTFAGPGRWCAACVLLVALVVIGIRRDRFDTMEVFS